MGTTTYVFMSLRWKCRLYGCTGINLFSYQFDHIYPCVILDELIGVRTQLSLFTSRKLLVPTDHPSSAVYPHPCRVKVPQRAPTSSGRWVYYLGSKRLMTTSALQAMLPSDSPIWPAHWCRHDTTRYRYSMIYGRILHLTTKYNKKFKICSKHAKTTQ